MNARSKNLWRRGTALALSAMLMLNMIPASLAATGEDGGEPGGKFTSEFSAHLNEDKSSAEISLSAVPTADNITITGIDLPDGSSVPGASASFTATENGDYAFTVHYDETTEAPAPEEENAAPTAMTVSYSETVTYALTELVEIPVEEPTIPPTEEPTIPPTEEPLPTNADLRATAESDFIFDAETQTITSYVGPANPSNVEIPATIGGVPVLHIGNKALASAFGARQNAEKISSTLTFALGSVLQTIGDGAFSAFGTAGTSTLVGPLTFPNTLTSIGESAFAHCGRLSGPLTIPDSCTYIGASAFYWCTEVSSLDLGNGIQTIGESAFLQAVKATGTLTIPDSCTSMGDGAFGMMGITTLNVGNGLKETPDMAFISCKSLTTVTFAEGFQKLGTRAFTGCTKLENVNLPESLKEIGTQAFSDCTSLETIKIPDNCSNLMPFAFSECTSLKEVHLPVSIQAVGADGMAGKPFGGCTALMDIYIPYTAGLCPFTKDEPWGAPNPDVRLHHIGHPPTFESSVAKVPGENAVNIHIKGYFQYNESVFGKVTLPNGDVISPENPEVWEYDYKVEAPNKAGIYTFRGEDIEGAATTYDVSVGTPYITADDINITQAQAAAITESQLLEWTSAAAEDEFGTASDLSISAEDVARVKAAAVGSVVTITIEAASTWDGGASATKSVTITIKNTVLWTVTYPEYGKDGNNDNKPDDVTVSVQNGKQITVNPNGGSWTDKNNIAHTEAYTITIQGDYTLAGNDPTRDKFVFMGWAKTDGTGDVK